MKLSTGHTDRVLFDTNSYISSLSRIVNSKSPISIPLAVIAEIQGLVMNERTSEQAKKALEWIQSKPTNLQIVTQTGVVIRDLNMNESWKGSVDDLILDLAQNIGYSLVTSDVNLRMRARTRGIKLVDIV